MAWDRNSAHYPRAVAQADSTLCWGASLEWWLRCMSSSRTITNQNDLMSRFVDYWEQADGPNYGTVTAENLVRIMASPSIRMDYTLRPAGRWDSALVTEKLAISPVLIAYLEVEVNGFHVNVIHSLNNTPTADVNVMDPNRGRYRTRNNARFITGDYLLGWART